MGARVEVFAEIPDPWGVVRDPGLDARFVAAVLSQGGYPRAVAGAGWVGSTGHPWRLGRPPRPLRTVARLPRGVSDTETITPSNASTLLCLAHGPRTVAQIAKGTRRSRTGAGAAVVILEWKGWAERKVIKVSARNVPGCTWSLTESGREALAKLKAAGGHAGRGHGDLERAVLAQLLDAAKPAKAIARALTSDWGAVRQTLRRLAAKGLTVQPPGRFGARVWTLTLAGVTAAKKAGGKGRD